MKKLIYSTAVITVLFLSSCGSETSPEHNHSEMSGTKYACPMKCEDDKTYSEKGECPVCEMDLEEEK